MLKPLTLRREGKTNGFTAFSEIVGDPGVYDEIAIIIKDGNGEAVADILIQIDENLQPRVLLTTSGDGYGDHTVAVSPLLDLPDAVDTQNTY